MFKRPNYGHKLVDCVNQFKFIAVTKFDNILIAGVRKGNSKCAEVVHPFPCSKIKLFDFQLTL